MVVKTVAFAAAAAFLASCGNGGSGTARSSASPTSSSVLSAAATVSPSAEATASIVGPDAAALSSAGTDNADWLVWGKTFGGNRYTGLSQITKGNVAQLRRAWVTPVNDNGEEEASPIVYGGKHGHGARLQCA